MKKQEYIYPQPANSSGADWAGAQTGGMTLREHYAGLAMVAFIQSEGTQGGWSDEGLAAYSISMADALIARLKETT